LRSRAGILVIALLAVVASQGCGSGGTKDGPPFRPGALDSPQSLLITDSDIAAVGRSKPYSGVLTWWQALQQGNVKQLRHSYVQPIGAAKARHQIANFKPRNSMPVMPETHLTGRYTATVRAQVWTAIPFHGRDNVISVREFPTHYFLARTLAGWKLRVDSYEHYTNGRNFSQLVVG
jgi:hypothetical protein